MSFKNLIKKSWIYPAINPVRLAILRIWERRLDDAEYFKRRHKKIFGYVPDFSHPTTFNEKIIHRILFDRNPLYTHLADKLKARIYITQRLRDLAFEGGGR